VADWSMGTFEIDRDWGEHTSVFVFPDVLPYVAWSGDRPSFASVGNYG
jgi:hypothetical protein